jgi:hypothetical protein
VDVVKILLKITNRRVVLMSRDFPECCTMIRLLVSSVYTIPLMHLKLNRLNSKSLLIISLLFHLLISFIAECDKLLYH